MHWTGPGSMEPAGIWVRVSSGKQDEANQVPEDMAWVTSHGYDLKVTYTVHGKSAFKGNKKFDQAWAQVLADMKAVVIRVLVVWKQDRLDRKLQTFQMLAQVLDAGGRVEFVTQPHLDDLATMGGRIALKVQEEIAYEDNEHGKSGRWWPKTVSALVRNPAYMGFRCEQDPETKRYGEILHRCGEMAASAPRRRLVRAGYGYETIALSADEAWADEEIARLAQDHPRVGLSAPAFDTPNDLGGVQKYFDFDVYDVGARDGDGDPTDPDGGDTDGRTG